MTEDDEVIIAYHGTRFLKQREGHPIWSFSYIIFTGELSTGDLKKSDR